MEQTNFIQNLYTAFAQNGLEKVLDDKKTEKLFKLYQILVETNKTFNLTAITEENDVILKHFVDCASVIKHIPHSSNVIDVGCGAGFPSLPIAILRDDVYITPLDSTAKKISFIKSTAELLNLKNITPVAARAEEYVSHSRESYDVAISRAVARLNILDELCIPFVKKNGLFIAMKAPRGDEEYTEAKNGLSKLGCELVTKENLELRFRDSEISREIYVFSKKSPTPSQYPRNFSQISKKPL